MRSVFRANLQEEGNLFPNLYVTSPVRSSKGIVCIDICYIALPCVFLELRAK